MATITPIATANRAIAQFIADTEIGNQIVHGDDHAEVQTQSGPVKSYAHVLRLLAEANIELSGEMLEALRVVMENRADGYLSDTEARLNGEVSTMMGLLEGRVNEDAEGILASSLAAKVSAEAASGVATERATEIASRMEEAEGVRDAAVTAAAEANTAAANATAVVGAILEFDPVAAFADGEEDESA